MGSSPIPDETFERCFDLLEAEPAIVVGTDYKLAPKVDKAAIARYTIMYRGGYRMGTGKVFDRAELDRRKEEARKHPLPQKP